jgi:hypothetical protein
MNIASCKTENETDLACMYLRTDLPTKVSGTKTICMVAVKWSGLIAVGIPVTGTWVCSMALVWKSYPTVTYGIKANGNKATLSRINVASARRSVPLQTKEILIFVIHTYVRVDYIFLFVRRTLSSFQRLGGRQQKILPSYRKTRSLLLCLGYPLSIRPIK